MGKKVEEALLVKAPCDERKKANKIMKNSEFDIKKNQWATSRVLFSDLEC